MENTKNVIEGMSMEFDNTGRIVVNYRITMAFFLLIAVVSAVFALVYACGPHEVSRRVIAFLLGILIPMPWVGIVRMNHQNVKHLSLVKMNSEDRQAMIASLLQQSLSLVCVVYAVIIVLSGNLFSHWG